MTERKFTTAHYAALLSTLAILTSVGSLYVSKLSYDLTSARDERELLERTPVVDIQLTPNGRVKSANLTIYIYNRGDLNIVPHDVTALHLLERGELYLSDPNQSLDKLSTHLSLTPMGVVPPKGAATMKASVSGVTDGKDDWSADGADITFVVRIRLADTTETINTVNITRRITPRGM